MRHLRWLPLTFFAGTHGFAVFAPYATCLLALAHLIRRQRRRRARHQERTPNTARSTPPDAIPA